MYHFQPPPAYEPQVIQVDQSVKMVSDPKIEYTNRQAKEHQLKQMKHKFLELMNEKITEARKAYTQVIEEKAKYRFGHSQMEKINKKMLEASLSREPNKLYKPSITSNESQFLLANVSQINARRQQGISKIKIQDKKYDFKNITEVTYFNKAVTTDQNEQALKLRDIDNLDSNDFNPSMPGYEFLSELLELAQEFQNKIQGEEDDKSKTIGKNMMKADKEMLAWIEKFPFQLLKNMSCILLGNRSKKFDINYMKHLIPNARKDYNTMEYQPLDLPMKVSDLTCNDLMSIASGRYSKKQAQKYEQLLNQKKRNVKILQDENQLEKKYNDLKAKIVELKKAKVTMKSLIKSHQAAQTEKIVGDQSLNELIDINTQRTLQKINDLVKVKEKVTEDPAKYTIDLKLRIYSDVHKELRQQLFCLLMAIAKDQQFINHSEFFQADSRQEIEDRFLQAIYFNLNTIRDHLTRSKQNKLNLLNIYLNLRKAIRDYDMNSNKEKAEQPTTPKPIRKSKSPVSNKKPWL